MGAVVVDKVSVIKEMFCDCCGMSRARLLEKLETCEWKPANEHSELLVRSDGLHFQHKSDENKEVFYTRRNILTCCVYCGVLLKEEDIHAAWEVMGEAHGRPDRQHITTGYECHYCGAKVQF